MSGDVSIELGSAIPYAVDRILALFGKDALSASARERIRVPARPRDHGHANVLQQPEGSPVSPLAILANQLTLKRLLDQIDWSR